MQIKQQMTDNIHWIKEAGKNKLVVGSQARILYADAEGRIAIAEAFNKAIRRRNIAPVVIGRDHHDVSGTDSPSGRHQIFMTDRSSQPIWLFRM